MRRELKTFEFECDKCHKKVVVVQTRGGDLPDGWTYKEEKNCGMTDYTRYDEYCASCSKEHNSK